MSQYLYRFKLFDLCYLIDELIDQFNKPTNIEELIEAATTIELATEIYTVSCMVIDSLICVEDFRSSFPLFCCAVLISTC